MVIVRNVNNSWQVISGIQTLERMVSTFTGQFHDGRTVEIPCDPYPVSDTIDMARVAQLVKDGIWSELELEPYGLKVAIPFEVPEGKQRVGNPSYFEENGQVFETYAVEDLIND